MKVHYLKCWPMYFDEIQMGRKTFEIRSTVDRIFQAGDQLLLQAFDPEEQKYIGAQQLVDVLAVYYDVFGMKPATAVMSIRLADYIHTASGAYVNDRQQKALLMLKTIPNSDLYEGADARDTQRGSGQFHISYSGGRGPTLSRVEVDELKNGGLIKLKYPESPDAQCYVLTR